MKSKSIENFNNTELLDKLKKSKTTITIFSFLFIVMIICCLFFTARNGLTFVSALPLIFFPILVRKINEFRKIKNELDKRIN